MYILMGRSRSNKHDARHCLVDDDWAMENGNGSMVPPFFGSGMEDDDRMLDGCLVYPLVN